MLESSASIADIGGGRSLSYQLSGSGSPTVILESGMGASALEWAVVAPWLAETTTVLTYDRAGFGQSTPAPPPHTGMQMADDCLRLIETIGVPGPYLLVGHSWGGVVARFLIDRIPERIAGLVLVDATHEGLKMSPALVALLAFRCRRQAKRATTGALARSVAAGKGKRLQTLLSSYPPPIREQLTSEFCTPEFHLASGAEVGGLIESLRALATLSKPQVPVVAITGGNPDHRLERRARAKMTEVYRQLASDWPSARHVLAPNSGHFVPQDDTDLLVEVVTDEIERCRAAATKAG